MKQKNKLGVLLLLFIMSLFIVACGNNNDGNNNNADENKNSQTIQQNSESETISESESEEETESVKEAANLNLLTGIADLTDEAIGKRPVAVMVNNVTPALPQYGVAQADIIFEILVEGDETRFMALYADYTQVPKVCSVRSCRKYFPAISEGFDAIYIHWGGVDEVLAYADSLGTVRYNGIYNDGKLFARDQDRRNAGYALEHTGYFDGTKLADVLVKDNVRLDIEADKSTTAFTFHPVGEIVTPTGDACTIATINFGGAKATFTYDTSTNTYLKQHNGKAQIDGVTNTQLAFTNVFVLEANVSIDTNGVHKLIDWTGGTGYYISNGAAQKITWSKANEQSPIILFDENGNELSINRGKSYFAINYSGRTTIE